MEKKKISNKKRKQLIARLKSLRKPLNENLKKRVEHKNYNISRQLEPIYDDVYCQGVKSLEQELGSPIKEEEFTCLISDNWWIPTESKNIYNLLKTSRK
jgi:hypothetical protein